VGENWMSIYLILTLLKGIAIITPSATDDRIISLFSNVYNSLRTGKAPESLEDK
jgi:hypothetical protein